MFDITEFSCKKIMKPNHYCIFGAGSVGCYIGGRLAAAGYPVTLIGRKRIQDEVRLKGIRFSDFSGTQCHVPPDKFRFATDPEAANDADLVMVTVKSAGTREAGRTLATAIGAGTIVLSLQNGMRNTRELREALPRNTVRAGIVLFNVLNRGHGHFHQGSEGGLETERYPDLEPFIPDFFSAGLPTRKCSDIKPVQWAKLLINLNNPVNALSGLPLKEQLSRRPLRQCFALAQKEALQLLRTAGIRPARLTPLPPRWLPGFLGFPDTLFRVLAAKMLAIDPLARSSMWEDLEAGRRTEIDYLNGEIVGLAEQQGMSAPVNTRLIELIRDAENGGRRDWTGEELLSVLRSSSDTHTP